MLSKKIYLSILISFFFYNFTSSQEIIIISKVNDEIIQLGYYYNPVTAGLFNKKYNVCGVLLLNDANKKKRDLFSLGMGGY